jgi:hypothetical protein
LGIAIKIKNRIWATASFANHREFIEYTPKDKMSGGGGESIIKTKNYYAGVFADIKLWRWIAIQPEFCLI